MKTEITPNKLRFRFLRTGIISFQSCFGADKVKTNKAHIYKFVQKQIEETEKILLGGIDVGTINQNKVPAKLMYYDSSYGYYCGYYWETSKGMIYKVKFT